MTIVSSLGTARTIGIRGVAGRVRSRLWARRARIFHDFRHRFEGVAALEIGGPSTIFAKGGAFPIYGTVAAMDNCNFAQRTIWEGEISRGATFRYAQGRDPGIQYVAEAGDLAGIAADTYDLVVSSHTIEHTANPLKALREWRRVLKDGGALLLVAPHKDGTFDHRRPVTSLSHLADDLDRDTGEDDLSHLPEILELHDLTMDPGAGTTEQFRARSERNAEHRALHHHAFVTKLVKAMVARAGFSLLAVEARHPFHICILAEKSDHQGAQPVDYGSPFRSDRP